MIIKVDTEGYEALTQLCDIALKSAGLKNLDSINLILRSTEVLIQVPQLGSSDNKGDDLLKSQEILKEE